MKQKFPKIYLIGAILLGIGLLFKLEGNALKSPILQWISIILRGVALILVVIGIIKQARNKQKH